MLLFLGSKDGVHPVPELTPDNKEFFDQETTTKAFQLIQDRLQERKLGSPMPTLGTTAAAHCSNFISSITQIPGNVTFFGFLTTVRTLSSKEAASLRLQEKNQNLPENLAKLGFQCDTWHAEHIYGHILLATMLFYA